MKPVRLEINGRPVAAEIEPRQHLADFVREEMLLTGTPITNLYMTLLDRVGVRPDRIGDSTGKLAQLSGV